MRRTTTAEPRPVPKWKTAAIVAALVLCAGGTAILMRRGGSGPEAAEEKPPAVALSDAMETPKEEPAAASPAPAPAAKPRGIRFSRRAEGSLADPTAPPYPLADYKALREAELKKWRETKVDLEFDDVALHDVVTEFARRWGLKVGLDAAVSPDRHLSISISGMDAAASMEFLTEFNELAWVVDGNGDSWLVPPAKKALYESKEGHDLSALEGTGAQAAADRAPAEPSAADLATAKKMEETRFSPDMPETTLFKALKSIYETTGIWLNADYRAIPKPDEVEVSLTGKDVTVREALDAALAPVGLGWRIMEGVVTVTTVEELDRLKREAVAAELARQERVKEEENFLSKSVALQGEGLSIRDVADRISKALGVGYQIDPATWSRAARYGFDGEPHTLREIFQALAKGAPVAVTYREGKLWYVASE
ncbi:MAG: STN domain-containing protein [Planctomycetes bacterium]|nr:STN domain-containing protein [Planctomycetota bacterium]